LSAKAKAFLMRRFTALFLQLDQTNKTKDKIEYLKAYFMEAPDEDKLWALALFTHRRPKRNVKTSQLREWCRDKKPKDANSLQDLQALLQLYGK
jgi:hypothetical protein